MYKVIRMAAVALAVLLAASCSKDRPGGAALLSQIGPDFDFALMIDPAAVARSAGDDALSRIHTVDSRVFETLYTADGLDKESALVVGYSHPVQSAILLTVTDGNALDKSLAARGYKSASRGVYTVYSVPDGSTPVFVTDEAAVLWVVKGEPAEAPSAVDALKARIRPLPVWLTESFAKNDDRACTFCVRPGADSLRTVGHVVLDGSRADILFARHAADGSPAPFIASGRMQNIGKVAAAAADTAAMLSVAVALPSATSLTDLLEQAGLYAGGKQKDALDSLNGCAALSFNMADPNSADWTDFSNFRLVLAAGTAPGAAPKVLGDLRATLASAGVPVGAGKNLSVTFAGQRLLEASAPEPDMLLAGTPGYRPSAVPQLAAGTVVWVRADIPARQPLLEMAGVSSGLRIRAEVVADRGKASIDFIGSDKGFIAGIIDILHTF